eukprot:8817057-Pyramimonas_sp.AAC.1
MGTRDDRRFEEGALGGYAWARKYMSSTERRDAMLRAREILLCVCRRDLVLPTSPPPPPPPPPPPTAAVLALYGFGLRALATGPQ